MDKFIAQMFWNMLLTLYRTAGREAALRALTPPRRAVEAVCRQTGADVDKALRQRDQAAEETLEFLESMADSDYVPED